MPPALVAALAGKYFASMAAVAQYMSWPNYGPPTYSITYGMNGTNNTNWARAQDQTFVANNAISVGITIYIASVSFVLPIGQPGVITPDGYMSCAGS